MAEKKEVKHHKYHELGHKSLDDIVKHIQETHYPEIGDAFTDYDNWTDEKHLNHLMANILIPSFDEFYTTVKKDLDSKFTMSDKDKTPNGNASLHKKEKEVKGALGRGLLSYLKKARPEMHKALMKTVKDEKKADEFYDVIAHQVDTHVMGLDPEKGGYFTSLYKQVIEDEDATVNSFKVKLDQEARKILGTQPIKYLRGKKMQTTVGRYEPFAVANFLKDKLIKKEGSGYDIEEKKEKDFMMHGMEELMHVYQGVKTGTWSDSEGRAVKPSAYHVAVKKEEKKKK